MFKEFFAKLDQKYLKISLYASITVLLTVIVGAIAFSTVPFWSKLWAIFTAVLKPIIIGGILFYLLLPIVNRLERLIDREKKHKWSRAVSVLITYGIIVAVIMLILVMIFISLYKNVEGLDLQAIQQLFVALENEYSEILFYIEEKLSSLNISSGNVSAIVVNITSAAQNFFSGLLFGVIFSIYFLLDETNNIVGYWKRALTLIFGNRGEARFKDFMKDADSAFSGYIRGQLVDAAIVGVLASIALSLAAVPYGVVIGCCIGFGNLIPYFGPILGYAATVIACLPSAQFDKMIIGLVIIAVLMFIDGNIINPKLLSDNVDVHPLLVVAALIAGGAVGGIAGMLIAVPSAALIKMQFDKYLLKLESKKEQKQENQKRK